MKDIPEKFTKPYDPGTTEDGIYDLWLKSGYFNPDNLPGDRKEMFSIVLPPPNVTGVLHMGHAYEDTLQDSFVRFQRMRGKKTLWVPGTDSAAIATQARVEKNIKKEEKKSRHDLGRKELVKRVNKFAKESESTILSQIRKMGASLDWDRYAYTLDEKRYHAVLTAFKNMYDAGLIYRGNRIVNWDPKGQTTVSDDEVVYEERDAKLYTFRYSADFPIAIATTRLETKVGDTAVAVHPDDKRYQAYIGKEYDVVFCGSPLHIKIIADQSVDQNYGTGALGVTPAHSSADWDLAEKYALPVKQVINEYAKMSVSGELEGKKTSEARELILDSLKKEELLEKEEGIKQNVSTAERTGAIIEPLPKLQWWIAVDKPFTLPHSELTGIKSGTEITLKELMRMAVENGDVAMPQDRFKKIYFHWIENLRDWCISRQIWFGHRIPVWYRGEEIFVGVQAPEGDGWVQEEDVLDTWFSSALWTFSTLGWPEETADLKSYHPTSFMSPAYEILPLWVSRMILMSGFHLGQSPFKTVIIHGLIRDKQGRKFSKSLGNGIDPLEMINTYGADALRMALIMSASLGSDGKFDENTVRGYKRFANKLWNITRFVLENTEESDIDLERKSISKEDEEILQDLEALTKDVTKDIESYRLHLASEKIYHYIWHTFADQILEESKKIFQEEDERKITSRRNTLLALLDTSLRLLHPFMPFVTEEIWSDLPKKDSSRELLIVALWPK